MSVAPRWVTSNLPFDEWTSIFGSERLTGALLDRLTHHVHILEMNGESFRLNTSKKAQRRQGQALNTTFYFAPGTGGGSGGGAASGPPRLQSARPSSRTKCVQGGVTSDYPRSIRSTWVRFIDQGRAERHHC
jgi:hypothetical protein